VLGEELVKGRPTDLDGLSGTADVASVPLKRPQQDVSLDFVACGLEGHAWLVSYLLGKLQIFCRDGSSVGHDHGALDSILQFPDISGP
jgi:hypothetical protein